MQKLRTFAYIHARVASLQISRQPVGDSQGRSIGIVTKWTESIPLRLPHMESKNAEMYVHRRVRHNVQCVSTIN
jgi:hypothetical protein